MSISRFLVPVHCSGCNLGSQCRIEFHPLAPFGASTTVGHGLRTALSPLKFTVGGSATCFSLPARVVTAGGSANRTSRKGRRRLFFWEVLAISPARLVPVHRWHCPSVKQDVCLALLNGVEVNAGDHVIIAVKPTSISLDK